MRGKGHLHQRRRGVLAQQVPRDGLPAQAGLDLQDRAPAACRGLPRGHAPARSSRPDSCKQGVLVANQTKPAAGYSFQAMASTAAGDLQPTELAVEASMNCAQASMPPSGLLYVTSLRTKP